MCGIVGYLGKQNALPILLDGLKRLEYRGYDSAGISLLYKGRVSTFKAAGRVSELDSRLDHNALGNLGLAHTRWATHGQPSESNAHPHSDCQGRIWLVHNGIIENYRELRQRLIAKGHIFRSETDTEVLAHLIEEFYDNDLTQAIRAALGQVRGAYGLAVISADEPDKLIASRCGSPLLVGLSEGETIVASDASAILRHTNQVIYLEDGEIAVIRPDGFQIVDAEARVLDKEVSELEWDVDQAEKLNYPHFMLKEIYEQPEALVNSIRGRICQPTGKAKLGGLDSVKDRLRQVDKLMIVACGTASYAGMVGEYMLEEYAGLSTEVEFASEFRYRKPILDEGTALLAISQSGETADTLAAIREAKEKGAVTLGIVNVVGSTIARETDAGVYNHIGPEIAVASTKAYTSQLAILALLTVFFGRQRQMSFTIGERILSELVSLSRKMELIFSQTEKIKALARAFASSQHFAFLGRKYNYPTALEGALKLKELSYIHAEGYPSGEMKHGSIALIDQEFPTICLVPRDSVYEKNVSNMEEIKSRGGPVIAVTTEGNTELERLAEGVVYIPKTLEMLTPLLAVVPLQLFAYYAAVERGCDVDKPRNLAKSVTVE
jgi:glucosamine--fructose-6-phosphate aminotransferase (isomerizing)